MIINAKFTSTCPCCSKMIQVGQRVEWSKGEKAVHAVCAARRELSGEVAAPMSAAAMMSIKPAKKSYGRVAEYDRGANVAWEKSWDR